jgi:hypothetical protein
VEFAGSTSAYLLSFLLSPGRNAAHGAMRTAYTLRNAQTGQICRPQSVSAGHNRRRVVIDDVVMLPKIDQAAGHNRRRVVIDDVADCDGYLFDPFTSQASSMTNQACPRFLLLNLA